MPASAQHKRRRKAHNFWGTVLRLLQYMFKRAWGLSFAVLMSAGAIILGALAPSYLGRATDEVYRAIQEARELRAAGEVLDGIPINFDLIKEIILTLIILYVIQAILRFFQSFILARSSQRTVYHLRKDLKQKISELPIEYFDTHGNGDIMSRAVNDVDQIANTLQQSLIQLMNGVIMFVGVLVIMYMVNWILATVVVVTTPISALLIYYIAPKSQRQFSNQQRELGKLTDQVEEAYSGHTIIKTYNKEEDEIDKFLERSAKLNEASWKAQFLAGTMMPLVSFARDIGYFGIGIIGGWGVINGTISIGHVQAFMDYVNQFAQPVRFFAQLSNTVQVTIASAERIFEIIDEDAMDDEVAHVENKSNSPYKVEFDGVQFGYGDEPEDSLLMTDFNLQVHPGEMVAIVGPTGAGKSTLINLLERFYDVSGGGIYLEGTDIRNIPREQLRERFSMVLQDTWLFNGTIWENIAYGNDDKADDDEAILEASKAARVDSFVRRLPHGYETIINEEGSNLSQGQRQLITIARAFLADPEILILDEATSSVDTRTETLIQEAMNNILAERTSFVIAHRLSTIQDADKIIVMNQGDVIETGTHDELLAQDGFYAGLYNAQFSNIDEVADNLGWNS